MQADVRNILVNNGLTELSLGEPDELEDPTYIIWYCHIIDSLNYDSAL